MGDILERLRAMPAPLQTFAAGLGQAGTRAAGVQQTGAQQADELSASTRQASNEHAGGQRERNGRNAAEALAAELAHTGVRFASSPGKLDAVHNAALVRLADCVRSDGQGRLTLQEGGVYDGCWLESTGTINAEVLTRFVPDIARSTIGQFADLQRDDGLIPYKVTASGPAFKQIQLVTPPARSAWNHYLLHDRDRSFLQRMYTALARYDGWLERHRNTRGTGCVEAFCTFDTGHDLSPRFWHVPDTPYGDDPTSYDPHAPLLPLLAPDLTASVYCSRLYLARMAAELGLNDTEAWRSKADATLNSLLTHCFHANDGFFYDVDSQGRFNRIQSDVLLRVLACEVGDAGYFASSLENYLLNTRKFFAKYPLTSLAMDDPRFDPFSVYNTWGGAVNFLTLLRTPHAFEKHGRHVELTWIMQPIVSAISRMTRFGQCLSPWTGEEGYTESYSPALLCALDYMERLCGIEPTPEGELRFTGLLPQTLDHGVKLADETAYSRRVDGSLFELHNTREQCAVYKDGRLLYRFPAGARIITSRDGELRAVIGMSCRQVEGLLRLDGHDMPLRLEGNATWRFTGERLVLESAPGIVMPTN